MERRVEKICPYCKTEIKEGEALTECVSCLSPHHTSCWEENRGCTTFGCSEQNIVAQNLGLSENIVDGNSLSIEQDNQPNTSISNQLSGEGIKGNYQENVSGTELESVFSKSNSSENLECCERCGNQLAEEEKFCPNCGGQKIKSIEINCSKCASTLEENQEFCSKCGQKVGLDIKEEVSSAINNFNNVVEQSKNKPKKKIIAISITVGIIVLLGLSVLIVALNSKPNFKEMYGTMTNEAWCEISSDGTTMTIDTNWYDSNDEFDLDAYYMIETVNADLGFPSTLFEEMGETVLLDGLRFEEAEDYSVNWRYSTYSGLEVTYTINE